ncbi:MAG: N(G),N(G)-dimethylarginine dimethylaminohydrolase [Bacteroidetes bacterium]|nr:N(G),N(G)-dimethylarginine dimethylaminohydrolase [Bacteroidota bacterium]
MQFTKAIVRIPCERMTEGLSSSGFGKPDYIKAIMQHEKYVQALKDCGLEVIVLPPVNDFPDSSFVEDTALLTPAVAVITLPGAPSRKGETRDMQSIISCFYNHIEFIREPGTLEAGDVMMVGSHFFIGLSERTNIEGASQLISILEHYVMTASVVEIADMLHLKSGVSYLENGNLLATKHFHELAEFKKMNIIPVAEHESYAANSLWINGSVLVPEGYPETLENISNAGYETIILDVSEFRKLDGGVSCLSLRF